jgi:hypothetical protein
MVYPGSKAIRGYRARGGVAARAKSGKTQVLEEPGYMSPQIISIRLKIHAGCAWMMIGLPMPAQFEPRLYVM